MALDHCTNCGDELNRLSFEDIWSMENSKIECPKCGHGRDDDTPQERQAVLVNKVYDLMQAVERLAELAGHA